MPRKRSVWWNLPAQLGISEHLAYESALSSIGRSAYKQDALEVRASALSLFHFNSPSVRILITYPGSQKTMLYSKAASSIRIVASGIRFIP